MDGVQGGKTPNSATEDDRSRRSREVGSPPLACDPSEPEMSPNPELPQPGAEAEAAGAPATGFQGSSHSPSADGNPPEPNPPIPPPDEESLLGNLLSLDVPEFRARQALMALASISPLTVESCFEWLLEHESDAGIDDPILSQVEPTTRPADASSGGAEGGSGAPSTAPGGADAAPGGSAEIIAVAATEGGAGAASGELGALGQAAAEEDDDDMIWPPVDESQFDFLTGVLGMEEMRVRRALMVHGGRFPNMDEAAGWLFDHADDPALDVVSPTRRWWRRATLPPPFAPRAAKADPC